MASVFKKGRWVDASGAKCRKDIPGAVWKESRFWTVKIYLDGKPKLVKAYTDKAASEQLGAKLERAKSRGEQGLVDPYKAHRNRPLTEHVKDWIGELHQLGRDDVYVGLCKARMNRLIAECGWGKPVEIKPESFIRWRETAMATVGRLANKVRATCFPCRPGAEITT